MIVGCCVAVRLVCCSVLQCVVVCVVWRKSTQATVVDCGSVVCVLCVGCILEVLKWVWRRRTTIFRLCVAVCMCCSVWQRVAVCISVGCILEDLKWVVLV